mmetsp:Transcript_130022/g.277715  ORF Transcript_130022/g.277715 Transcript_130022/m.277715 type:complete len:296 (-) Transcript_130022:280-1167(-)
MPEQGSVIVVPGERREELLANPDYVLIESDDGDSWETPPEHEVNSMMKFVSGRYRLNGPPKKSWTARTGVRFGWNAKGVFVHSNHRKRFFGIEREHASVVLKMEAPEAVPEFHGGKTDASNSTDNLLGRLVTHMPDISHEMRTELLRATFKRADVNKNGTLSKVEMGSLMRRVCNTMSAKDIQEIMALADANHNNKLTYDEFATWLQNSAPDEVTSRLQKSLGSHYDFVLATFRLWDRNGDGMISDKELRLVLKDTVPHFKEDQVRVLVDVMDKDDDGKVDYDEFVDFLFIRHKK